MCEPSRDDLVSSLISSTSYYLKTQRAAGRQSCYEYCDTKAVSCSAAYAATSDEANGALEKRIGIIVAGTMFQCINVGFGRFTMVEQMNRNIAGKSLYAKDIYSIRVQTSKQ
jgi:hypothetical protein